MIADRIEAIQRETESHKRKLASEILRAISTFEEATGLTVTGLSTRNARIIGKRARTVDVEIHSEVSL